MSEWKLVRASGRLADAMAKNKWSDEQLETTSQSLKTEIATALWPCADLQLEFRGFQGYDAITIFHPIPRYNSQEGSVSFGRQYKGNPLVELKKAFDKATQGRDLRLLLQTANGGVLNLTNYIQDVPLRTLWLPTWLWKTTFDSVCTANKHIMPLLHGLMLLLPSADQSAYDILFRAVIANQWELKDKSIARDPQESLISICASYLASPICSSIDCDLFFDQVSA